VSQQPFESSVITHDAQRSLGPVVRDRAFYPVFRLTPALTRGNAARGAAPQRDNLLQM
jgi:hypothetical protein